jgi:predicted nucleic acid-binding protein
MPDAKTFFDTNVLLYLLSEDAAKADRAEELIANGAVISVQFLNDFAAVASRKLGMSWSEIRDVLGPIRAVCEIEPITVEIHERGVEIAERYGFHFMTRRLWPRRCSRNAKLCIPKTSKMDRS